MVAQPWQDTEADTGVGAPPPLLTSLHFLLSTLRRRWRTWIALGCVGLSLGLAYALVVPPKSEATATLLLVHDAAADPAGAMETDVNLLRTRAVAAEVIDALGLDLTPHDFQAAMDVEPLTSTVLVLTLTAYSDEEAVRRASATSEIYLDFRADQLDAQTTALVEGYQGRLTELQERADALSQEYDRLSSSTSDEAQAAAILTQRSEVTTEIGRIQQEIEDATLGTHAVVTASGVVDPASAVPRSETRRLALLGGSGLIAGLALGIGIVILGAVTSDRLRRRGDVALALGVPVQRSAARVRRGRWGALVPGRRSSAGRGVEVLSRGVEEALDSIRRRPRRVALATIDDPGAGELVLADLAVRQAVGQRRVFLVDLSERGRLAAAVGRAYRSRGEKPDDLSGVPVVFRPDGLPALAQGPIRRAGGGATALTDDDPRRTAWRSADVVLVLARVDPDVGVGDLRTWADHVVLLVTAGRSTPERLASAAELIRFSGAQLLFSLLVGTDGTDESSGKLEVADKDDPVAKRA
jgi:capsular polysaccharide biosynthesis protein